MTRRFPYWCILAAVLVGILIMSVADGAILYVDDINAVDDSSTYEQAQNPATPWKTIPYIGTGAHTILEGDTVIVKNCATTYAKYYEYKLDYNRVNRTVWTTYQAAPGHSPAIAGIGLRNGSTYATKAKQYLRFIGFTSPSVSFDAQYTSYVDFNDCDVNGPVLEWAGYYAPYYSNWQSVIRTRWVDYVWIQNCVCTNGYEGVDVETCVGAEILHNTCHQLAQDGIRWAKPCSHINVHGNRIYDLESKRGGMDVSGTQTGTFTVGETCTQYEFTAFRGNTSTAAVDGRYYAINSGGAGSATEATVQYTLPANITINVLRAWTVSTYALSTAKAPEDGNSWTIDVRKDAGEVPIISGVIANANYSVVTTSDVPLLAGDKLAVKLTFAGSLPRETVYVKWSIEYDDGIADTPTGGTFIYDNRAQADYRFYITSAASVPDGNTYKVVGNSSGACIFQGTGVGGQLSDIDGPHRDGIDTHQGGCHDIEVTDNILWECPVQGITIYAAGLANPNTDVTVKNNLVWMVDVAGNKAFVLQGCDVNEFTNNTAPRGYVRFFNEYDDDHYTNSIIRQMHNNILYEFRQAGDTIYGGTTYSCKVENHGNNIFQLDPTTLHTGFSFPFDVNGPDEVSEVAMTGASLFVNYAGADFNIPNGSPAEDRGNPIHATTHDVVGTARTAQPDIGAYEYVPETGANHAPIVSTNSASTVHVPHNSSISITVYASDADEDVVVLTSSTLPSGATFVSPTFTWQPIAGQVGTYEMTFTGDDGTDTSNIVVSIIVDPPVCMMGR